MNPIWKFKNTFQGLKPRIPPMAYGTTEVVP
jgi:hypothetical protein